MRAASITGPILALDAINLTIDGHTYGLADVGFDAFSRGVQQIGGLTNGVNDVTSGTNDFFFVFNPRSSAVVDFAYSISTDRRDVFETTTFSLFAISPVVTTPEPASLGILGAGILGLIALRRRSAEA